MLTELKVKKEVVKNNLPAGWYYWQGNEACAEGAIAAGCRFYAGYPITPANEIMNRIIYRFKECHGKFIQMEDELGSIAAVIGASWAGAKAMTATSGPGLSLMMENIGFAAMTETPCVIVDVQRAGPSTGQATKSGSGDVFQIKWGSHGDYEIIALSPWSVQEMYDMTIKAFNLSECFRVPVAVMADEAVGHLRENIFLREEIEVWHRFKSPGHPPFHTDDPDLVPPMPSFGEGEKILVTSSTHDGWGYRKTADPLVHERLVTRITDKIRNNAEIIAEAECYWLEDMESLVVAYGISARAALWAVKKLREEGKRLGLLRLKTLWPFPERMMKELGKQCRRIIVPEMNRGQISREVGRHVTAEVFSVCQTDGEVLKPKLIMDFFKRSLS